MPVAVAAGHARGEMSLWRRGGGPEVGPIGFDLSHDRLSLVQISGSPSQRHILASATAFHTLEQGSVFDSPEGLRGLAARAFKSASFKGRRIVTALPPDRVKLMLLSYELGAQQDEPELILSRVQERIHESLDDCVVDYLPIRKTPGKPSESSALVAVAREEAVVGYLELLRSAGLQVEALEIGPVAVRRLVSQLAADRARDNVLVINFERDRSYLIVLWGRRLILYREIDFGVGRVVELLSKTLDLSPGEAESILCGYGVFRDEDADETDPMISETVREILKPGFLTVAEQVSNAVVYAASRTRGETVDLVYLLGPVSLWPGADRFLAELVSAPVRTLDPTEGLRGGERGEGSAANAGLAVAAGLALRGMEAVE